MYIYNVYCIITKQNIINYYLSKYNLIMNTNTCKCPVDCNDMVMYY